MARIRRTQGRASAARMRSRPRADSGQCGTGTAGSIATSGWVAKYTVRRTGSAKGVLDLRRIDRCLLAQPRAEQAEMLHRHRVRAEQVVRLHEHREFARRRVI